MWLLGCSGCLLGSYSVVARVFWLPARELQCGFYMILVEESQSQSVDYS